MPANSANVPDVRPVGRQGPAQEHQPLVEAEGVTVTFDLDGGRRFTAVESADVVVREHEKLTIIGPSGCGKTTLLMVIAGFIRATSGQVRVAGHDVDGPDPERAVVFQDFDQLFPWRTVEGNMVYALRRTRGMRKAEARDTAMEYLRLVGISEAADKHPHQLSGGMKQRCAIARALAIKPQVLLMDEPFGALDAIRRTDLQQELIRIAKQTAVTVVMVTHSIQEAVTVGDRVLVMGTNPGHVKAVVDTGDVSTPLDERFDAVSHELRALLAEETTA